MLAILKFIIGLKANSKTISLQNIQMINSLNYENENNKKELIHSEIFKGLTGTTAWIHHINYMFNSPDPGRIIEIYRKSPTLVAFGETGIVVPKFIKSPFLRFVYLISVFIMMLYPIGSFIYIYNDSVVKNIHYPFYMALGTFIFLSPMTVKGVRHLSFLFDANEYYQQCFPDENKDLKTVWHKFLQNYF